MGLKPLNPYKNNIQMRYTTGGKLIKISNKNDNVTSPLV